MFCLDGNVAESEPYKALAELARAANKLTQFKRKLPPDKGKRVLKELSSRHSDLAHSLKTGLSCKTLCFSENRSDPTPPGAQANSRRLPALQPRRPTKTSNLEKLLLSDPSRVRVFRKIIDRQSGKPLHKTAKFKITQITDHTYFTDNGKGYSKNNVCLKPNFRYDLSTGQKTLGDRLQASKLTSTSSNVGKRPATLSQPTLLEKRPVSHPMVADLTVDSSSEGSSGSNTLQKVREFSPVEKPLRLQEDVPPVTFATTTLTPQKTTMVTVVPLPSATQSTSSVLANPRTEFLSPTDVSTESLIPPSQHLLPETQSSYPSLSLPAQSVVDDSEIVRTSSCSKKATQFVGDPLRHSVKLVEEDNMSEEVHDLPAGNALPPSHSPRKPLIRNRPQLVLLEASFSSFVNKTQNGN